MLAIVAEKSTPQKQMEAIRSHLYKFVTVVYHTPTAINSISGILAEVDPFRTIKIVPGGESPLNRKPLWTNEVGELYSDHEFYPTFELATLAGQEGETIPFIGFSKAIVGISCKEQKIYGNTQNLPTDDYGSRSSEAVYRMTEASFGKRIADELKNENFDHAKMLRL